MKSFMRAIVVLAAIAAATLAFGFVLFATSVMRSPYGGTNTADGIVVLSADCRWIKR